MRQLTFAGYLKSLVPALAGVDTLAVRRLAQESHGKPRVAAPLVLMAVVTGRAEELARHLSDQPQLLAELRVLQDLANGDQLEVALASDTTGLREEYMKTWRSFVARRDAGARDERLKRVARERVLALETTRRVTRYRMAKDLGLNPGNLHAFLTQGNVSKLSLQHAYDLVDYLEAA